MRELDKQARSFAEERFALAQARLQRVQTELNGALAPPEDASMLKFEVHALSADKLAEDATVLALVAAHRKKFPRQPSP